ncbi:MAG: hypothetical protein OXG85_12905 [Chloroflexi bacterium]|nr:hypothetical protein [Chloroflexota bacterium]
MPAVDALDRTNDLLEIGETLYAARQSGLIRLSADGGNAHSLFESWLPGQDVPTTAIAARDNLLLAGINGGVARSEDGGASWQAQQFRAPAPLVTCLALSPEFDSDGCALAGTFEDGVFRSTDGGLNWRAVNHGLFDHSIFALALSPAFADDGIAYVGASSGIYRSDNGGRLWWDMTMRAGDETVLSLALSESGALYAGCESHGLLRSADGGATWIMLLETDGAVNSLALAQSGAIVAQVDDGVVQSQDKGASWREVVAKDVECLALGADGDALLLALADGSVRREAI